MREKHTACNPARIVLVGNCFAFLAMVVACSKTPSGETHRSAPIPVATPDRPDSDAAEAAEADSGPAGHVETAPLGAVGAPPVAELAEFEGPVTRLPAERSLDAALASLQIPPDWYASVEVRYDTGLPWKEARLEVRRLLALGGASCREAIKLTCLYHEKGDIGDGHELPMYLFMGGEIAWATKAYIEMTDRLLAAPDSHDHIHAFLDLAACYVHFGEFDKALATLHSAMARLPAPPWRIAREADVHERLGDVYARMGNAQEAKERYAEAVRLYPTSTQPYGRHLLKRHAARIQSKLDLLDYESLETATLRDGSYTALGLGYSGDQELKVTITIQGGRIARVHVAHAEKIDQGATTILPERIVASQSLRVDAITGATVTCDAIVDATFRALKQAGLK